MKKQDSENYINLPFNIDLNPDSLTTQQFFKRNAMFKDIIEENKKDAFEADAYSQEFLCFIP